ncbi:MAG: RagB/SusD family nutrient uptake outer membrane protein [Bacteroidota bacterium]
MINKGMKIITLALIALMVGFTTSCVKDLDTVPIDDSEITPEDAYGSPEGFRQVLAKLYAGYAATGQQGPAGEPDIDGIDEGFSSYVRTYWVTQEIPTDEAVVAWSDPGLPQFNTQSWSASNDFVMAIYSRIFYQVTLTNEFIREAKDEDSEQIQGYLAEARFLRALSYYHALDLFGERNQSNAGVPFVTEDDPIGAFLPEPINSSDLFEYIEGELLDIEDDLPAPGANEYGRANQGALWTLLTKLYLNAEVYTDEAKYTEAITYAKKVIDEGGYQLDENYEHLFLADNHTADGIIFPITFDGENTKTYGGTNFIVHAQVGGSMEADNYGIDGGWQGHRVTRQFVDKFDVDNDGRAMFHTDGQTLEIENTGEFTQGYAVTKWKNINSDGTPGNVAEFADIDFPMFRLADVYLMYAEAVARGGQGGDEGTAVDLINQLRERAYGDDSGNISASDLTPQFVIDERARELYWEGHRRTDLVRHKHFTTNDYVWAWKGGIQDGAATSDFRRIYPIPSADINANPNLIQNEGY